MFVEELTVGEIVKLENVAAFTITKIIKLPGQYNRLIGVGYQGVKVQANVNKSGTIQVWE